MKITPLEIRQKDFEKKLRGYDKEEVQAFLQSLSHEWERMLDEVKEYKIKLEYAEREVQKLREVETSLFKTLKTAEDTGANLVDQANKAADLHMRETQMKAEAILNESKNKAKAVIENAEEEAKEIINEVQEGVRELEQNHKKIETHRDSLIRELMSLASDLVERVEKTDKEKGDFRLEDQIKRVRNLAIASEKKIDREQLEAITTPIAPISVEQIQEEVADKKAKEVEERKLPEDREVPIEPVLESKKVIEKALETLKAPEMLVKKEVPKAEPTPSKPDPSSEGSFFDLLDED